VKYLTNTITTHSTSFPSCKISTLGFIAATAESTSDQTTLLSPACLKPVSDNHSPSISQEKTNEKLTRFSMSETIERNTSS